LALNLRKKLALFLPLDLLPLKKKTRAMSHSDLAIYIKKYLMGKEELLKFKNFTMQKCNL
jgi:hypothetical protein